MFEDWSEETTLASSVSLEEFIAEVCIKCMIRFNLAGNQQ